MSEHREVTLGFLAEQQHRILSEIRILRDDVDVLAAPVRGIDNSYDRLDRRMEMVLTELREMRAELRATHAQQDRTAARVRALEEDHQ